MMKLLGKEGQAMLIAKYLFSMMLPKVAYAMNLALFDVESSEFVAATIRNAIRLRRENKVKNSRIISVNNVRRNYLFCTQTSKPAPALIEFRVWLSKDLGLGNFFHYK